MLPRRETTWALARETWRGFMPAVGWLRAPSQKEGPHPGNYTPPYSFRNPPKNGGGPNFETDVAASKGRGRVAILLMDRIDPFEGGGIPGSVHVIFPQNRDLNFET